MIRHIFLLIWNQRKNNAWLWAELTLVSIFLWGIVDYLYVTGKNYYTPLGYDIEHTYLIDLKEVSDRSDRYIPEAEKTTTSGEDLLTALDRIRTYPGVEYASLSDGGMPYVFKERYRNVSIDTSSVNVRYYLVTPSFFDVFRTPLPNEKTAGLNRKTGEPYVAVATEDLVDEVPGGFQAGQPLYQNESDSIPYIVRGISSPIRGHEYTRSYPSCFFLLTDQDIAHKMKASWVEICVRVTPEADPDFAERFRKDMSRQMQIGNLYLMDVQSLSDLRHTYLAANGAESDLKTRLSIAFFLLINIFLGIIGTFWLRTEHRKGEMGLRMALGSTRNGLRGLLLSEGIALLIVAFVPAMLISLNAAYLEVIDIELMPFTWGRFLICQGLTFLAMSGMIVLGIWYPARQAARLKPANALHYE